MNEGTKQVDDDNLNYLFPSVPNMYYKKTRAIDQDSRVQRCRNQNRHNVNDTEHEQQKDWTNHSFSVVSTTKVPSLLNWNLNAKLFTHFAANNQQMIKHLSLVNQFNWIIGTKTNAKKETKTITSLLFYAVAKFKISLIMCFIGKWNWKYRFAAFSSLAMTTTQNRFKFK